MVTKLGTHIDLDVLYNFVVCYAFVTSTVPELWERERSVTSLTKAAVWPYGGIAGAVAAASRVAAPPVAMATCTWWSLRYMRIYMLYYILYIIIIYDIYILI